MSDFYAKEWLYHYNRLCELDREERILHGDPNAEEPQGILDPYEPDKLSYKKAIKKIRKAAEKYGRTSTEEYDSTSFLRDLKKILNRTR